MIASNENGTGSLAFSSGTGLTLERSSPVAPFDAEVQLAIDVIDLDDTAYPLNPATFGGTGVPFDVSNRFQFGRLRFENAAGSELVDLPMRLRTQQFDGVVFVDDSQDSCSSVSPSTLDLTRNPTSLATTPSLEYDPIFAGDSGLALSAPSDVGTVDIVVDLGASGANLPWLRYDWPRDGNLDGVFDDDPYARATFGIWQGRNHLIYMREVY
ncbi:MAG: hypothetical protein CL908_14195 [Deltaproteobacteria bacterium]|nr:hypothetical protein [Deltaproteobacteria bacterium]